MLGSVLSTWHILTPLIPKESNEASNVIFILTTKLRHREVKSLSQDDAARKWQRQHSNIDDPTLESKPLTAILAEPDEGR